MIPDFTNFSAEAMTSVAVALAYWAYLIFFCVWRAKKVGLRNEEPPLWFWGGTFKIMAAISAFVAAYIGMLLPMQSDLASYLADQMFPLVLALVDILIAGGLIFLVFTYYKRWKAIREDVVYEPLSLSQLIVRILVVIAILCVLGGLPLGLGLLMGLDGSSMIGMLLGEGAGSYGGANIGLALGIILGFVFFWIVPDIVADRLEEKDVPRFWAESTGLELFRWAWLGLTILAALGAFGGVAGLGALFSVPAAAGTIPPLAGAMIFYLFWVIPMKSLAKKAEAGDVLAKELERNVRLSGIIAFIVYTRNKSGGVRRLRASEDTQLCPTCLRPINDVTLYRNFKFDECPHCQSFIPPVFTMLDYVKNQSTKLLPLIEARGDGSGRKLRRRGEDETRLMQEMLRALLAMAVSERGTDLHLLIEEGQFVVRCRVDGSLYTMMEFSALMNRPMISSLKVQANLDITERRKPQDGRFSLEIGDRKIDIRLNTSPIAEGEMATLRLLYRHDIAGSVSRLGMSRENRQTVLKMIHRPNGLILVTGPTGSGKTTTLYNALETLTTGERNIVTLEDPIEYELRGLSQMQVDESKDFTFASGLRTILRQDPDVIMIGEIRDGETAKMAIDASATGHLVFTTLHTTDSTSAVGRLQDLGVDSRRCATVLSVVMAQRLVRLVCPQCSTDQILTRDDFVSAGMKGFPNERAMARRGLGCPQCHETGFYGREGVYEFFIPNDELRQMIVGSNELAALRECARKHGMRTLREDGLIKVLLGRTTLEEVQRMTT